MQRSLCGLLHQTRPQRPHWLSFHPHTTSRIPNLNRVLSWTSNNWRSMLLVGLKSKSFHSLEVCLCAVTYKSEVPSDKKLTWPGTVKSRNPYVVSRNSEDTRATLQLLASTGKWRRTSSPPLQTFSNVTGINAVVWIWMEKLFWRGRLTKDEDLPTPSWCLEQVFARLETCMPSWTATDLLHAVG